MIEWGVIILKTILITGGAGYIGSHTVVELLEQNYKVIIVDNLYNSSEESIRAIEKITKKKVKFYRADLRCRQSLEKIFSQERIDAVIHFAAMKAVGESVLCPLKYYNNNVSGTIQLLEVMEEHEVYNLVFSSSATVYDASSGEGLTETHPRLATNPYGRTKIMIEDILSDLSISSTKWNIISLRYFNPLGAHPSGEMGEDPNGIPNNLVPYVTQVAVGRLDKVKVFGNDYPTPDGTGIRDYVHIMDLAQGHVRALQQLFYQQVGFEAYNLGTGNGYSVLEIIHCFEEVVGEKIPYEVTRSRPGHIASSYAVTNKAFERLNWKATKNIHDMCEDAWRWQKKYPNGFEK